ncbi:ferredoxin family protein [Chloroflexota bacterium]
MARVEIYNGWCKKCGICIAFCPPQALGEDEMGYPVLEYPEKCNACGWCEIRCPDFAIVVQEDEEAETGTTSGK